MELQPLIIFTDGAARKNPGPGGWGAVLVQTELSEVVELGGNKPHTTNNEMELTAIVSALSYAVNTTAAIHIYTDSSYVIKGITQWIHGWKANNWQTQAKQDVSHRAIWEQLDELVTSISQQGSIMWHHVPGHAGVPGNERADTIATMLADGNNPQLYRGNIVGYGHENITDVSMIQAARQEKQKASSGKAFAYLSVVDGLLEKHDDWASCQKRVHGKKALYRKALSPEHAQEIIQSWKNDGHIVQ